jgi:glycine hydroxymethyltransferase
MTELGRREWVPDACEDLVQEIASTCARLSVDAIEQEITDLIAKNREIHERDCVNLNPATNVMNPKAEVVMAQGLGARPSLGYPGDKYEMGLEAIERIEVIAAELAAEVFGARYAEIRVPSGAISNLYCFMATAQPGDTIIVQPPEIAGHVTHHNAGAAGLYGLNIHSAPCDPASYSVDVDKLRALAQDVKPKLITLAGSLNLFPHPVADVREIADEVGAKLLYDAAHMSGMIAGHAWQQPLEEGAHLMTMSTYKSLGGPPSGLIVTNDADLAQRLDAIAFPGMTANFDAAKSASLAISLLDWKVHGTAYADMMKRTAKALAKVLLDAGVPLFAADRGITESHQFAIEVGKFGGGQTMAKALRKANILTCGIGLPVDEVEGDANGLRIGTPEIVRWGMDENDMDELGGLMARILAGGEDPADVAPEVTAFRRRFSDLHYMR